MIFPTLTTGSMSLLRTQISRALLYCCNSACTRIAKKKPAVDSAIALHVFPMPPGSTIIIERLVLIVYVRDLEVIDAKNPSRRNCYVFP